MIPLLLLAALTGSAAALLWARSRQACFPRGQRVDRVGGRALGIAALLLAVSAPLQPVQAVFGLAMPEQCRQKPHSSPPVVEETVDIDALKAELRHRRLEVGLPPPRLRSVDTREVSQLTGPGSSNRTDQRWNVFGTDLGHPFVYRDRLGLLFGDTFGDADRNDWRSNVIAWAHRPTPDQVVFDGMPAEHEHAEELIGSLKLRGWEQTVIPTNAVAVDDRIVVHYMSIVCWGVAGSWVVDHAGLAVSDDGGASFSRTSSPRWAGDTSFVQVAFVEDGDHLYAFGIPAGRAGPAHLARVVPERLTDPAAWSYWDGEGWRPDATEATPLVSPPVGELSVGWNETHERWVMMYLHEGRGGIVLRTAERLTGPWSSAELVASGVDFPQLYAPYLLPWAGEGSVAHFIMSRYDVYNVFLMRTRLVPAPDLAPAVPH